jgi:hypothetical protein
VWSFINCLSAARRPFMELPFHETLAAPKLGAIHHKDHVQSCVVIARRVRYLTEAPAKTPKTR